MKETKIQKNSEVAQPDSQTEQNKDCHVCQKHSARVWESILTPKHNCPNRKIKSQAETLDNFTENSIETLNQALADKDKTISQLKEKITDLEAQNNDLDYLLNSGRNKFEHERNKRLKELETKLNQPLTNQESKLLIIKLLKELAKRIESNEIRYRYYDGTPYLLVMLDEKERKIIELNLITGEIIVLFKTLTDFKEIKQELDDLLKLKEQKDKKDKTISELEAKLNQPLSNRELLKELAKRIVEGQLELEKPNLIKRHPGKTAEEIVQYLENKENVYNKLGYPFCDIAEIYDKETNRNPLGLYYFIVEVKQKPLKNLKENE